MTPGMVEQALVFIKELGFVHEAPGYREPPHDGPHAIILRAGAVVSLVVWISVLILGRLLGNRTLSMALRLE